MGHDHTSEIGVRIVLFQVIVSGGSWERGRVKQAGNMFGDQVSGSIGTQHFLGSSLPQPPWWQIKAEPSVEFGLWSP